ncbi:microtubule-associated protein futsch isoform X1 [Chaetodon trifascialis]|uniref:microtubule-associated protein futsch isoform X1 n=1 Tax=Chaetodon trifascialis TaxID=109706 RepID=UPI003995088F
MSDIKMSVILTAEQMEHLIYEERAGARGLEEKEPLAIMEHLNDRLEKVGEIQQDGINISRQEAQRDDAKKEKWTTLYETQTVEVKYPPVVEPVLQETCIEGKASSRYVTEVKDMTGTVSHLTIDMDQYLEQRPVVTCGSQEDLQDRFEQVSVKCDSKRRPPDIKKPIRKKLRDRERSGCSSSEGELERMSSEESLDGDAILKENAHVATTAMDPPASPLVVDTPIGSIKDRVKALQNKVKEEEEQKFTQDLIPQAKSSITIKRTEEDMPELPRVPKSPKSPRSQTERLEETMSVKDLLKAFQTGQDPSKNKAGLFEHKAVASSCISSSLSQSGDSEEMQKTEQSPTQESKTQIQTQDLTIFHQQSDVKICDKTGLEDQPKGLIKLDSEESLFISDSAYIGKTVKFADIPQRDNSGLSPQGETPELSGKETMSVKELMKAFQNGQDPSKNNTDLFEHKAAVSSHISTLISESADSDEIQKTEQSPMQEPKSQMQAQDITISHQQSVAKICDKTDLKDRPVSMIRQDSEESLLISDSAYIGRTIKIADTISWDDGSRSQHGEVPELSEKETMSVKELMKAFQTGQDPSKNKAELFEHKATASSHISTLILESADSEEIQKTEQSPMQEPKSQMQAQDITISNQQIDVKKYDKTNLKDRPVSLIRQDSEESLLISDSAYVKKTVKFAETIPWDDGSRSPHGDAPELSEKETMSVKELIKTFQTADDPSKTQAGIFETKDNTCISTLISESGESEEVQMPEQSTLQQPRSQIQTQDLTRQTDVKTSDKPDLEDQPFSLIRDNSEESQLISDMDHFRDVVKITDTIHFDDGRVSPQREEPGLSGVNIGRIELEEPVIGTGRSLSEDLQISPDRRPSEDFTADIKAELEQSPEYQLFKQTSAAADMSYQREVPEEETLDDDSVTNPLLISSHCLKSYFEEDVSLIESQMRGDDLSPESPKHEAMAEYSNTSVHTRAHLSSLGGSENDEEPMVTHEMTSEMLTFCTGREEMYVIPSQVKKLEPSKENTIDHESKIMFTHTDTEVTEVKTKEPQLQEVCIDRTTSSQASTAVKDMSGMLSLMNSDMDQYLQARPVARQTQEEDIVQEKFEQIIITKDKDKEMQTFVTDGKKGATVGSTTQEIDHAPRDKHSVTWAGEEAESEFSSDENEGMIVDGTTQQIDCAALKHEVTRRDEETEATMIEELPMKEEWVEEKTSYQPSTKEKEMSGMLLLLNSDLGKHLKDMPVKNRPPEVDIIQERFEEVILTKIPKSLSEEQMLTICEKTLTVVSADVEDTITRETHEQTDVIELKQYSSSVSETPFQQVCIDRKAQEQQSTTERDMTGMLSLLSCDLDQYLKEKPVTIQSHPQEDVVHESYKQVILRRSSLEDKIGVEDYEHIQANEVGVTELSPSSVLETPFQQVCIDRKAQQQQSTTEKDMTGMLSLLSCDLDQYIKEKPVAIQSHPQEDVVHESYKQVILRRSSLEDKIGVEDYEHIQANEVGGTELSPSSVLETPFQQVCIDRKAQQQQSTTEKDMTGMLSLLSCDLDQYLKEKPVAIQSHPQEDVVHESYKQVILRSSSLEDKIGVEDYEHIQANEVGGTELSPSSVLETPFQQVCIDRKAQQHQSTIERDIRGMLSLLSCDLDQYLKEKPVTIESDAQEDVVHESYKQVVRPSTVLEDKIGVEDYEHIQADEVTVTELSPSSVLETPFQEVCIDRKAQQQQSTTEKDMTGMLSLLSCDLDQYIKEKPLTAESDPEEDAVHESYKQVVRPSTVLEDKIGIEDYEHIQDDEVVVTELSPSSVLETPFQEVCIDRKAQQQQSTIERDMTGMLSLLSCDLDQHLKERPVAIQCHPEEKIVRESYKEVILTKDNKRETLTFSPDCKLMSPEDTNLEILDINRERASQSELQTCCHGDEGPKSFSSEEGEGKISPSAAALFSDSTEETVDMTKLYATVDDSKNDNRDVRIVASHSVLKAHEFLVHEFSSNTPQRPANLENLNTMVFGDQAKESCHPDSLESSPVMEDRSSKTSPDSIEPSPTRESSCPDSLEGSPTQSKDSEKMPAKTAVYEDYASQLEACFAYDKNIYRDESDHDEQENNYEVIQTDSKICDGENVHTLMRQDSLEIDDGEHDITNKQFTPEEEMFKMAAKIKTFEEMEQEAKMKTDTFLDVTSLSETGDRRDHEIDRKYGPDMHSSSQDTLQKNAEKCAAGSTHTLFEATDISLSSKEKGEIPQPQLNTIELVDSSLCLTATHKEEPDPESEESLLTERDTEIHKDKDAVVAGSSSVTDTHFSSCVANEHHPDDNKEVELPLTDCPGSVSKTQSMVCTEELKYAIPQCQDEDDEISHAHAEAKEQINLFPAEERKTPEETPVQTPGNDRTPDPFQFQEGKLFEMTRGGAIDMTRRNSDENGEGYAFFHIGEHPVDEVVPAETGEGQAKSLTLENKDSITDTTLQEVPQSSLTESANEIPSPKPRTLIKSSSDKSESENQADLGSSTEVQPGSPSSLEKLTIIQSGAQSLESLGLDYLDSTIADLQSDPSTAAHSVYSEQVHDSSDSSSDDDDEEEDEDQCSVIEMSFSAAQAGIPACHQDSPPPLAIKPGSTIKKKITMEDSQVSELDQVQRKGEKSSTLDRRTRSEADSDTSKTSNKDRSYSDSSQPTDTSNLFPSKLPVMMQHKPLTQTSSSSSPHRKEIQLSQTTESSVRSSLDTDDISSASHRNPDSVIFTYDIPVSHSSNSDGNPLTGVQPSSGTEGVFQSKPVWDDTVETQMQRIIDDQTPECTPVDWQDDADRKEETLAIIADLLGFSWTELARELEFSEDDIQLVRTENPNSLQEQSHALLQRWVEREGKHATEDCLIKRLTKINRMDIVHLIETQMNKSVQEQTSRTYAEIEKTLDHSEVSVALSSVQEDVDSPRVVRRVESDRRPPPAVSEEDLSVASLLDIPSWAEPVGHTHSESMHGDLLEELEIPHELNTNLWTSEDLITQEPTTYDNLDEQADEMPDLPNQSVTEEKYKDENGHIVVRKVTRKIIRKCVSVDGVGQEQVSVEGDPQGTISMAEGDRYSKVVKRTVLKSVGDHTEVTFADCEGFSASRQDTAEGSKVSHVQKTTVVEGERTMTHQGDPSLASDLPSAQDDFKQGPHA